jgi:hypothetical protein
MSKTLLKLDIIGFVFVSVIGTLAHFVLNGAVTILLLAYFAPLTKVRGNI